MTLAWNGFISRQVAVFLLVVFAAFIGLALRQAKTENTGKTVVGGGPLRHLGLTVLGIVVLVIGSEMMVRGGRELALKFGISDAVIGLTLVAFGTSLPELAASVAAALKGQSEMSVGNVLGSNVFNLGLVIGSAFAIHPSSVPVMIIRQDVPFLCAVTLVLGFGVLRDGEISRREGVALLLIFAAYQVFIAVRGL